MEITSIVKRNINSSSSGRMVYLNSPHPVHAKEVLPPLRRVPFDALRRHRDLSRVRGPTSPDDGIQRRLDQHPGLGLRDVCPAEKLTAQHNTQHKSVTAVATISAALGRPTSDVQLRR